MRTLITITLFAILLSSCLTKKQWQRRYPPQIKTVTETETITKVQDTTIYVPMPADTVYLTDTIFIYQDNDQVLQSEQSFLQTQFAWSTAQVKDGALQHELAQKDTLIEQTIKDAIREKTVTTSKEEVKIHEVNVLTRWQRFVMALGYGFMGGVLITGFLKAKKLWL